MAFNASLALNASNSSQRVQITEEQDKLNISEKIRTSILPWRGQFNPQLVEYLIKKHGPSEGLIVDPFCGSGTVLYEAANARLNAFARDINPAAICLARVTNLCLQKQKQRVHVLNDLINFSNMLKSSFNEKELELDVTHAVQVYRSNISSFQSSEIIEAFLLLIFGNLNKAGFRSIDRATEHFKSLIGSMPYFRGALSVDIGDARCLPLDNESVDYIITSPPYINVFNYHQNYRPIVEALGYLPLTMAKAEMGANRKFRQNRYLTVIQYCMDMAQFFIEVSRILKPTKKITIVLGRESNVRGVPFKNGELIAAIASEGLGGKLCDWNERSFMNRFGETIIEDVLTILPRKADQNQAVEIGRLVGTEALRRVLTICPEDRFEEIESAVVQSINIKPSPYFGELT